MEIDVKDTEMRVIKKFNEYGALIIVYPFETTQKHYITIQNKPQGDERFTPARISCSTTQLTLEETIVFTQAMLKAIDYARKINFLYQA